MHSPEMAPWSSQKKSQSLPHVDGVQPPGRSLPKKNDQRINATNNRRDRGFEICLGIRIYSPDRVVNARKQKTD
jgi:hypothetical protein